MKKFLILLITVVFLLINTNGLVFGITSQEYQTIQDQSLYYRSNGCSSSAISTSSTSTSSGPTGAFTYDQVKTFSSEPVTSTWNLSTSSIEQWFLKQAGAKATINKFHIDSSNIGQITSAVEAAHISPEFFYMYTVNEGGGAGGFINHYGSDTSGGAIGNATRDAQYLESTSQNKSYGPATGGGEPDNLPTADAKQLLDAIPLGSIGVVYIQATSAVTAEIETLSGHTGSWSNLYGKPLSDMMQDIKGLGGDPEQGGSTVSTSSSNCSSSSAIPGQGIAKAVYWIKFIANDDGYGYDQAARTSGWAKYQSDPSCTNACGSFDCSSLVAAAVTEGGYFNSNPEFSTHNEASLLISAKFTMIASSANNSQGLIAGDILVWQDHTAMYVGNGQDVAATSNELGGYTGGRVGDQTKHEISIESYQPQYVYSPWIGVFRASN
jgi:hypothetical protein